MKTALAKTKGIGTLLVCLGATVAPAIYGIALTNNASKASKASPAAGFSGKVLETTNAANYTYVRVDTGAEKLWAAAPQFVVQVGDAVRVSAGMPMQDFVSKTLQRTFDTIYFVDRISVVGTNQTPEKLLRQAHASVSGAPSAAAAADFQGLQKAAGGHSIAEIHAQKSKWANQTVLVRGKVVKFNPQIMQRNWLHIKDGTGTPGMNDLTVTTTNTVKLGDTVLVKGTLRLDRDFGYGYKYAVLLENSQITVEKEAAPPARK